MGKDQIARRTADRHRQRLAATLCSPQTNQTALGVGCVTADIEGQTMKALPTKGWLPPIIKKLYADIYERGQVKGLIVLHSLSPLQTGLYRASHLRQHGTFLLKPPDLLVP